MSTDRVRPLALLDVYIGGSISIAGPSTAFPHVAGPVPLVSADYTGVRSCGRVNVGGGQSSRVLVPLEHALPGEQEEPILACISGTWRRDAL